MKTLTFTGHRPKDLGGYNENNPVAHNVKAQLKSLIVQAYDRGYRKFITGMAPGVDQWAGEILVELKKTHEDITIVAAVPFASQATIWPEHGQKRWYSLLDNCDEIYIVDKGDDKAYTVEEVRSLSQTQEPEPKYMIVRKLQERNVWMVDRADSVLAIWRGTDGGTGNCVRYAQSKGVKIVSYNPDTNKVEKL